MNSGRPPGQSIKTRVEAFRDGVRREPGAVRLDNPLKQGLKLDPVAHQPVDRVVRLDNPLKQGLKQKCLGPALRGKVVRLDNPLKQGLKQHRRDPEILKGKSAWTIH